MASDGHSFTFIFMLAKETKLSFDIAKEHEELTTENPSIESKDDLWNAACKASPKMFNALKFRISKMVKEEEGSLKLCMGVTDYKSMIGTNYHPRASLLLEEGERRKGDKFAMMASPVGVEALVKTQDNKFVFLQRSQHVAEAAGKIDCLGGHPEPSDFLLVQQRDDSQKADRAKEPPTKEQVYSHWNQIAEEKKDQAFLLFLKDSILKEVSEESGIPFDKMEECTLIGAIQNVENNGKPDLCYLIDLSLSSAKVLEIYSQGGFVEVFESTALVCLSLEEMQSEESLSKMAVAGRAGVFLYKEWLKESNADR